MSIRAAILGAGGIATAHAQALASLDGVALAAVADVDGGRAERLAERWGARAFSSLDAMLSEVRPDAVHILLPPELHARFAVECMAAGSHVFVEKPLCIAADECREIETAAMQFGRTVGVNHNVTFDATYLRLIEAIRARRLGAVQHVSVDWCVPFGDNTFLAPLYRRQGPGAVILETGPHPLSLIVRLVGEVRTASVLVSAEMQGLPDTWQLALRCERGTAQCLIAIARPLLETRVRVIGEDAVADADLRLGNLTVVENSRRSALFAKFGDSLDLARSVAASAARNFAGRLRKIPGGGATDDFGPIMRGSIGNFYAALRDGVEPTASLREGLAVVRSCLRVIDAGIPNLDVVEEETWRSATASS
jgi:predicted dehydrogenase